jgi:hypothetical protein
MTYASWRVTPRQRRLRPEDVRDPRKVELRGMSVHMDWRGVLMSPVQKLLGVERHPSASAGHVKKLDLLCMRPLEHMDRQGVDCSSTAQPFFGK